MGKSHAAARGQGPVAVVVGLDCITGLQTARILRDRGVPVIGLASDLRHFASRTRACLRVVRADVAGDGLVGDLERLAGQLGERAVLFPCTDASVLTVSRHRARLAPCFHVLLPDHDVVAMLMDKSAFHRHAEAVGLPVPRTRIIADRGDLECAAATLQFPVVLKPPVKTARWLEHTKAKAFKAVDAPDLLRTYERVHGWADVLIAQEWVEGGEDALYSCNAYFDRGSRPLVTFVARKLRQWPPHTGTSSLGQECRSDEVLACTVELFTGVGFHGLAYLEMKRDTRTGRHVVIEPNVGRPTGRSAIAEGAGVELLHTAYCDAVGLPLPEAREQRYGDTKWIDLRRDLQSAAFYLRRGELSPAQWWASVRGPKVHAVLSWRDPLPFLLDVQQAAAKGVRGLTPTRSPDAT
jgi:D-aspartate ligase